MTIDPAVQLAAARSQQASARMAFDSQLSQVRADLAARGVGGRIADRVSETAAGAMSEAVEIADENRAIIAGTVVAIVAWVLRRPLMRLTCAVYEDLKERITE